MFIIMLFVSDWSEIQFPSLFLLEEKQSEITLLYVIEWNNKGSFVFTTFLLFEWPDWFFRQRSLWSRLLGLLARSLSL